MDDEDFRTIWLSDVHLGSRACRVSLLLDFLRSTRCDTLYLVGDIIDLESLRSSFFWPDEPYRGVCALLLKKSQEGTRIVYIPGNHDDDLRALGRRALRQHRGRSAAASTRRAPAGACSCCTATNSTPLIQHGSVAAFFGSVAYRSLLASQPLRALAARASRGARTGRWRSTSRSRSARRSVTSPRSSTRRCRRPRRRASTASSAATSIRPSSSSSNGLVYCNDGDWVESCTALVEQQNGELEL